VRYVEQGGRKGWSTEPMNFVKPQNKQEQIDLAWDGWDWRLRILYDALPEKSPAKHHIDGFMSAIGEFKTRVCLILERFEQYERDKKNGIETEPVVRREYQG